MGRKRGFKDRRKRRGDRRKPGVGISPEGEMIRFDIHHRCPRSLGGSNEQSNIIWVPADLHKWWHIFAGNMNPYQIANLINSLPIAKGGETVICIFVNGCEVQGSGQRGSKSEARLLYAWHMLFKDASFAEALNRINSTWLDFNYRLSAIKK